jgi:hypothetical protein
MGPPVDRPRRSRPPNKPGASFRKRVPILGRCFSTLHIPGICGPRLDPLQRVERRRSLLGRLLSPTNRIRLAIKHPPWVSGLALAMATQPENVIAYSSWASALPPLLSPPRISLRNGCSDPV